jgi:glutamine amidotransferase
MCRHLAYTGPPVALDALLVRAPHSLVDQARSARHQTSGTENPDGWGVAWFDDSGRVHRHRSSTPMWSDPMLATLTETVAGDVVAAVRLLTRISGRGVGQCSVRRRRPLALLVERDRRRVPRRRR